MITSRLIHLKEFLFHNGVYNIPFTIWENQKNYHKVIKSFYAILYLSVIVLGIIGITFIIIIKNKHLELWLIGIIPLYIIGLFPILLKVHEYRFNVLAYPFLVIFSIALLNHFLMKFKKQTQS